MRQLASNPSKNLKLNKTITCTKITNFKPLFFIFLLNLKIESNKYQNPNAFSPAYESVFADLDSYKLGDTLR